jgi:hypothetical protein
VSFDTHGQPQREMGIGFSGRGGHSLCVDL